MKSFLLLLIAIFWILAFVKAQTQCIGQPATQDCTARRDSGTGGSGCRASRMWYYENGRCHSMLYRGCGGNGNRYCSRSDCERRCRQQG